MRDKQPKAPAVGAKANKGTKKKYQAPNLVEYGDLRRIVMAKKSFRSDGAGLPATKR